jgi:hypothetical protein
MLRFSVSGMLIFIPLPMIMSPGFWSAAQGPSHLASIVMVILPSGISGRCDVTVIVYALSKLPVITECAVAGFPSSTQVESIVIEFYDL